MSPITVPYQGQAPDWCVTVDTSGRQTVRTGHYYQRRDGLWVCANCGQVKA